VLNITEQLHGEFAKFLYLTLASQSSKQEVLEAREQIKKISEDIIGYENDMIDYLFSDEQSINHIDKDDLKVFITERTDKVLSDLKIIDEPAEPKSDISSWFYKDVSGIRSFDLFALTGNQYTMDWKEELFERKIPKEE